MRIFTPNHVQLVRACYPPSSAILTAGPDYRPNQQELSRLTYYASNRPGKLAKLGSELEKRAKLEAQRARNGNTKARASLLITLAIFKALATECKRDVSLLTPALIASLVASLSSFPRDLEVTARTASVFTTWTTYTDGQLIGIDSHVTSGYNSALRYFSDLSRVSAEKGDGEVRNRQRLVGIAALTGAITSDALYHSSSEFPSQVSIIIPGLLLTLQEADFEDVKDEAATIKQQPSASSTYLSEFRPRPLAERRAASIHVHVDGERGPSFSDVVNASLRALQSLLERSNANQVSSILDAAFEGAKSQQIWENSRLCCWLAQTVVEWTRYQYRYAVPKKFVDKLVHVQDAQTPTPMHFALANMIYAVFTSFTPLVNVSTSDIISYLLVLLIRRTSINPEDKLLPPLVNCTAALGAHIYYQDQIHDLAEELISRLVSVQVNGLLGRGRASSEPGREQGMRCLLAALNGLLRMADGNQHLTISPPLPASPGKNDFGQFPSSPEGVRPAVSADNSTTVDARNKAPRRTRVSPEAWQDTLALLCEADYGVRADYARALVRFIRVEVPKEPFALAMSPTSPSVDKPSDKSVDPIPPARRATLGAISADPISRFLNALHASVYKLATSSTLGLNSSPSESAHSSSQQLPVPPSLNVVSATPIHDMNEKGAVLLSAEAQKEQQKEPPSPSQTEPSQPQQPSRSRHSISISPSRTRRSSVPLSLLDPESNIGSSLSATPSDYSHLVEILISAYECLPGLGLLTGVPMLLALDTATMQRVEGDEYTDGKRLAVRELLANVWKVIGRIWDCADVMDIADKALASLESLSILPLLPPDPAELELVHPPEAPVDWLTSPVETPSLSRPFIDPELVVQALAASPHAQSVTGLDRQALVRRLGVEWTLESALKNSIERQSGHEILSGDGMSPFLKISPALMHIENLSLASLARTQHGVGVQDLREALEGRGSASNLALPTRPSSIRTLELPSSGGTERLGLKRSHTHTQHRTVRSSTNDVRDVLNRLGVGKQTGTSLLKASFPSLHNPVNGKSRSSVLATPYPT